MVFTHHITDRAGGFLVGAIPIVSSLFHREQYAAMNRLKAIPNIREGTTHDHTHGVIKVRLPHLSFDFDRFNALGLRLLLFHVEPLFEKIHHQHTKIAFIGVFSVWVSQN